MRQSLIERLKWARRWYFRKKYGLKNVHPKFLASSKMDRVCRDVKAGAYSYIGPNSVIYPKVTIGNYTMLANDVYIVGGDHNYRTAGVPAVFNGRDELKETIIGHDVWIGARSTIMAGVRIGNGAIVAAGAVVTKDVEPYTIYGGIPAKKIGMRFNEGQIAQHEQMLAKSIEEVEAMQMSLPKSHFKIQ